MDGETDGETSAHVELRLRGLNETLYFQLTLVPCLMANDVISRELQPM